MRLYKNYFKRENGDIFCFATEDLENPSPFDGWFSTIREAKEDYKEAINNYCEYYSTYQWNTDNTGEYIDITDFVSEDEQEEQREAQAEREHERSYHPCYRN